jgi:FtsZ-binding cell division protein ZapB
MIEGITTYVDNNPALVLEIENLENKNKKLQKENEELKIEVKVLERLVERLSGNRY